MVAKPPLMMCSSNRLDNEEMAFGGREVPENPDVEKNSRLVNGLRAADGKLASGDSVSFSWRSVVSSPANIDFNFILLLL